MLKKMWTQVVGGEVKVARTDKVGFPSVLFRKDYCCKFGAGGQEESGGVWREHLSAMERFQGGCWQG